MFTVTHYQGALLGLTALDTGEIQTPADPFLDKLWGLLWSGGAFRMQEHQIRVVRPGEEGFREALAETLLSYGYELTHTEDT